MTSVSIPATGHTEDTAQTVDHEGYRSCVCATCGESFTMGKGTILNYVELPTQGIQSVSESLDESYTWSYNVETGQIESQNVGVNSSTAKASLTFTFTVPTIISLNYGVSSEARFDKFSVKQTLDGETSALVDAISGEQTGTLTASFEANKEYTLSFEFAKDGSSASGQDKAWISQVKVVNATPVAVESIALDANAMTIALGGIVALNASVLPTNATDANVTWTSDNEDVASVVNGVVLAKSAGVAHITATAGDKTASCTTTVLGQDSKGDVNNSGKINIVDAQIIYDLATDVYGDNYENYPLPETWYAYTLIWVADANNDNAVDSIDAFAVQYFIHHGTFGE